MREFLWRLAGQRSQWFTENVFFVSWGRHWKGVYLHFVPRYKVRLFLWGVNVRRRQVVSAYSPRC